MTITNEQQNCPYCHGKKYIWEEFNHDCSLNIVSPCTLRATFANGDGVARIINYCPMCGRKINYFQSEEGIPQFE